MRPNFKLSSLVATALVTAVAGTSAIAQQVIVETRIAGQPINGNPDLSVNTTTYVEVSPGSNWANSTSKSAATGTNSARPGSRFASGGDPQFRVKPVLPVAGAAYFVDVTFTPVNGNASPDVVMNLTTTGGSGLPATTTAFQRASGAAGNWLNIGTLQLDPGVTQPELFFDYQSGTLIATGGRVFTDAFRFRLASNPCEQQQLIPSVTGPLGAGDLVVNVSGVDATATNVGVYQNGVKIGELTTGIVAGTNAVTVTTALIEDATVSATQTINGQESCVQPTGARVGGGANPAIRVAFGIRKNNALVGPVGADGGTTGSDVFHLGGTGTVGGGFGTAVVGGKVLQPSKAWQTVSFWRGADPQAPIDPIFRWAGTSGSILDGQYAVLESISFSIEEADTGPHQIYIDNITNGPVTIQDFDTGPVNTSGFQFQLPSFSGSTSPFLLLPLPNSARTTASNAATGAQSESVQFQFNSESTNNWMRLVTQGTAGGSVPNPIVDLNYPVSCRILVLPVGVTTETGPTINTEPTDLTVDSGDNAVFTVAGAGTGTLKYEWTLNGRPVGTDSPTLTLTAVTAENNGSKVRANVIDDTGSTLSAEVTLTVNAANTPTIGAAKGQPDNANVNITDGSIVTLVMPDEGQGAYFYAQAADGSAGIRVNAVDAVTIGDKVKLVGKLTTLANGERALINVTVTPDGTGATPIRYMGNKAIGGPGYTDPSGNALADGIATQGLLVKAYGKLVKSDFINNYFVLDDGYKADVADDVPGIKVINTPTLPFAAGPDDYYSVVGVIASEIVSGKKIRVLKARQDFGELVQLNP